MGVEELMRQVSHEVGMLAQEIMDGFGEATSDVLAFQFGKLGVGVAFPALQLVGVGDDPQAVVLKAPERVFGMEAFTGRPKVSEQLSQAVIHLKVGKKALAFMVAAA